MRVLIHEANIDILAINETKLDASIHSNEVNLPGYEIIRKDRCINVRHGGGVCSLRNNLNFSIREDLMNDKLECLIIAISKPRSMPFLVGTWYRPPNSPRELLNLFEDTIDRIDAENSELYLLGDLNCNLLAQNPDANTFDLLNILDIYDLTQLITEPTRITPISKSLIDLCITNYPEKVTFSGVLPLGISDHSLVYIIRKSAYPKTAGKIIKRRNFKHFNEANFLDDLSLLNWDVVLNYDDPNDMWRVWVDMLMGVVNKHAPIRETRIGKKRSPWITPNILQKMRTRDYLKKKFETTKDILTWNLYKKARNELNNILKQSKRAYFRTNLDSAKNNPKKTWNLINQLSSRNLNKCSNVNTVEFNGVEITDRHEVAEAFNTHFTEIGENLANNIPKTDVNPTSYIKPTNSVFSFKMTDVNYVKDLLREINTKKSSGPDNIPSKLLKIAMNVVAPSLTHIFNKSLCTSIYPKDWKMANVTPIYKNGAKRDLNNYRPISVISVVAKVFERIIHDQFYHYLTSNELLTNCQSGFRAKHSTVTSLLETTNKWSINIDNGLLNGVVFIDLKKAFDTVY